MSSILDTLVSRPPDSLLALIQLFAADPRPNKIDLGVGVYRDEQGRTPVFAAVKQAEARLLETQQTKTYLGADGDTGFVELFGRGMFGRALADVGAFGLQSPGGTGALRLGFDLIRLAHPGARVLVGQPTWANHEPIIRTVGLEIVAYPYFDIPTQTVQFDAMMAALEQGRPGDIALLHGCCHNPTGADLSADQWRAVAEVVARRGLLPFIDMAYQGLGDGLEQDAAGLRTVVDAVDTAIVSASCSKHFGLYRERVGALFVKTAAAAVRPTLLGVARANYSMPPDHGAAIVRTILEDRALTASWQAELESMRQRVQSVREGLARAGSAGPLDLKHFAQQRGMFSMLPIDFATVLRLREEHGIYMADNGRANLAGLKTSDTEAFTAALAAVMTSAPQKAA